VFLDQTSVQIRKMFSNTISVMFVRGFTVLLRMISLFVLAKFSSPEEFGVISLMVAAAEILKVIADFGIDTLSVRDLAITISKKRQDAIVSNIAFVKFFSGLLFYVLMILTIFLSKYNSYTLLGVISGLLLITSLWSNLPINYFQSKLKMNELVIPMFLNFLLALIIMVGAILGKADTTILFATIPLSEITGTLILFICLNKKTQIHKKKISLSKVKDLFKRSWPIAITIISAVLYTRLDIVVLGNFSSKVEIGYYGMAYRITEPFQFIAAAFSVSIYSHVSSSIILNEKSVSAVIKKSLLTSSIYSFIVFLLLITLSPIFIHTFLPQYAPSIPILNILSLALIFRIINNCLTSIIQAYGQYSKISVVAFWNLLFVCSLVGLSIQNINAVKVSQILAFVEFINMGIQIFIMSRITELSKKGEIKKN
jgi:O-antigen/teichoic acid export membrane protein